MRVDWTILMDVTKIHLSGEQYRRIPEKTEASWLHEQS